MSFKAPVNDILFTMNHAGGMQEGIADGIYADLADGAAAAVLEQAAKFAGDILAPILRNGDLHPPSLADGVLTTSPGWVEAYRHWIEGGWAGLTADTEDGGMGLPMLLNTACFDMWNAANMAFMLCPILSCGAIDALEKHATPELRAKYLPKIASGEWSATMNLTEPQAGSDLAGMRTKAERNADGTYKISGQKIFISYGDHNMTENILHLVLARLPGAPQGTRGISLFLVPKFFVDDGGAIGARNDVFAGGLEHKMGIHGSPTCTMIYGDKGGATGWLIGEENRGLACMFTMMNSARLATAMQGVSVAERATQQALQWARERKQGKPPGWTGEGPAPIAEHADVRRMLMTMKALTSAARSICYMTAGSIDRSRRASTEAGRALASERAALLTPLSKAFATDIGNEVATLGVQVHGGMGYIEETGAAQLFRDIRIAAIYEGTNGIQAIDLVTRKIGLAGGDVVKREIADMRETIEKVRGANAPEFGQMGARLAESAHSFERATHYLQGILASAPNDALAGATPYLRLFALARGGTALANLALAARGDSAQAHQIAIARFFADNLCPGAKGLEITVTEGAASVHMAQAALADF